MRRLPFVALALAPLALAVLPIPGCHCGCGVPARVPEKVLRLNLRTMRDVLQQSCTDRKRCPESLEELVTQGYLRKIPVDPITRSDSTWVLVYRQAAGRREIVDVHSGAPGWGKDGTRYADW
jgi:general secretion pathway protein G